MGKIKMYTSEEDRERDQEIEKLQQRLQQLGPKVTGKTLPACIYIEYFVVL